MIKEQRSSVNENRSAQPRAQGSAGTTVELIQGGVDLETHVPERPRARAGICRCVRPRSGVSLEEVRQFSRHKNINTLLVYRDRVRDV